jgi:transcriptional regulator with PAS, ATPase and Fis domain
MACGGLDSTVAESLLFGHKKGAFTGADGDRDGLLKIANGHALFLDEIQDLPQSVQRKLVRVLQDKRHRYRPVGADLEETSDFELVCASNQPLSKLQKALDPDFYDRVSMLKTTIPPLRECREDIQVDWQNVWDEVSSDEMYPIQAPESEFLYQSLAINNLNGNLRDLQKLAVLIMAYWEKDPEITLKKAIDIWQSEREDSTASTTPVLSKSLTRGEHIKRFTKELSLTAKERYGTWKKAADALQCDEKTLRHDAKE